MNLPIQKLELVERRWEALLAGKKLDTIRFNEPRMEPGLLLYEGFPSAGRYSVVYITNVMDIPLRDVLKYTKDTGRKPDEETLLKKLQSHYPEITLDSIVQYVQHLSPDETRKQYGEEVLKLEEQIAALPNVKGKPQLVFVANPFGFGPAGKLFAILNEAKKRYDFEWYFVGGEHCAEIADLDNVAFIPLDERNEDEIKSFLSTLKNPYVISSLNRFAIKAAYSLEIPCALVDGLTWLWNPVPDELLLANIYFSLRFPGVDKAIKEHDEIRVVSYIADAPIEAGEAERKGTLIHLGGMYNPLTKDIPIDFIEILSAAFQELKLKAPITICGGSEALNIVKQQITRQDIEFATLGKKEFDDALISCEEFITTPGLTATMEAFSSETPTTFLPPTNLSQLKVLKTLRDAKVISDFVNWYDVDTQIPDFTNMVEHDAIVEINKSAQRINADDELIANFVKRIAEVVSNNASTENQTKFIESLGTSGVDEILNHLDVVWNLAKFSS